MLSRLIGIARKTGSPAGRASRPSTVACQPLSQVSLTTRKAGPACIDIHWGRELIPSSTMAADPTEESLKGAHRVCRAKRCRVLEQRMSSGRSRSPKNGKGGFRVACFVAPPD